ncbi:glycoside hydrolase family 140 protein [Pseudonocardia nematodicida]|uniref:Glycoside hydrolase family 140 protein n=2 Tax=Pseudonocardia nematodicida TaxID=1206997 RepID=A0ABV1KJ58_9PSEU
MLLTLGLAMSLGALAAAALSVWDPPGGTRQVASVSAEPVEEPEPDPTPSRMEIDGRFLAAGGAPMFWLGDTAWAMLGKPDRDDIARYLDARRDQGFNVIQTVAIFPQGGARRPIDGDVGTVAAHEDHWAGVDDAIDAAAERGMYLAIHPVWGDDQTGSVVTEDNARAYGRFLGERYGDRDNVVWTLGGDHPADGEEGLWGELAAGLDEAGGTQLKTYHPRGDETSATWFAGTDWLDFHMIQGGHCLRYGIRARLLEQTYAAQPAKPFLDGEPIYEDHPYCWERDRGYSTATDVRRDAWWAVLGGAAGHTYGAHAVWQFNDGGDGELGARGSWTDALELPAAGQMRHLRELMESLPFHLGEPAPSVLTSDLGSGAERVVANRASDGSYLLVYSPSGREFTVDSSAVTGPARAYWVDPRTGERTQTGAGADYAPPSDEDWVLLVTP